MGLAIAAVIKGYKCIFTTTDKQSKEKVDALRAFGAEVIVCPTNVDPEDPRSYYSVSSRLEKEIPNSWKPNQYDNLSNTQAHYEQTGPEIWAQTEGKVTHLVVGVGTGGTITGTGKYLKEKNPNIKLIAIEPPLGESVEGLRNLEDGYIPPVFENWHGFELLDRKRVVRPRESIEWTRRLVAETGIFGGISSGASLAGAVKVAKDLEEGVVVFVVCDGGWKYLSTGAYTDDLDAAEAAAEKIIYF
jgi:cysteine synthase